MSKPTLHRVLVVDDAALVRLYYRSVLEPAGYEVFEALNGVEALEQLLGFEIVDLLIVDINMPVMDGLSFVRVLRQRGEPFASTPVLIISTEAGLHDLRAAQIAGANFYAAKPVAGQNLLELVALLAGSTHD
ncbi:response regulator [Mesorhizobium sp. M0037]|uniref:response regulator n=1 Tax=unclassified Mesorhizobium TaxID=325217 RepID=UPI003338140C